MTNADYLEVLQYIRQRLRELGFSGIDERIMSNLKGSDGPFWDLTYYLKHLAEEVALGSEGQLGNLLRRVRQNVQTESGDEIKGVRVMLSDEDRERYGEDVLNFTPDPNLDVMADELRSLIHDLGQNHRRNQD